MNKVKNDALNVRYSFYGQVGGVLAVEDYYEQNLEHENKKIDYPHIVAKTLNLSTYLIP